MVAPTTASADADADATGMPKRLAANTLRWLLRELPTLSVVTLGAIVLVVHAQRYMPFFADDSFISMRYAERLLEGKGLTWNDGERVEGYSNFLWVLCLAAISAFRVDMVVAARALGVACFIVCMGAIAFSCRPRTFRDRRLAVAAVGVLGIGLTGIAGVWAIAGLEQPLLLALVTSGCALTLRNLKAPRRSGAGLTAQAWIAPAVLFGLATWTRPDGALFAATVAGTLLLVPSPFRGRKQAVLVIASITGAFIVAQLAFRLAYYGEWVPNTARAKLAWTPQRLREGWDHVLLGYSSLWPLVLLAASGLPAIFKDPERRLRILVPLGGVAAWSVYLVAIGGDFFAAWRHFVPIVVLLGFTSSEALSFWATRVGAGFWGGIAASAALLGTLLSLQLDDEGNKNGIRERWEWQAPPIGALLRRQFGEQAPLFAVDAAGCLPWYSKLPSLDMLGLNDHYLAHHPPADMGTHALGHELGDGVYVLSRQPDLVLFGIPSDHGQPKFRGGFEMFRSHAFRTGYDKVIFQAGPQGLFYRTWMRRDSPKIGITVSPSRVTIPGYFFASSDATPAVEARNRRLGVRITPEHSVMQRVWLAPGTWRSRLESSGSKTRLRVQGAGVSGKRQLWQVAAAGEVRIKLSASAPEPAFVYSVGFERVTSPGPALDQRGQSFESPRVGPAFER